jgi:hypothetical protein
MSLIGVGAPTDAAQTTDAEGEPEERTPKLPDLLSTGRGAYKIRLRRNKIEDNRVSLARAIQLLVCYAHFPLLQYSK